MSNNKMLKFPKKILKDNPMVVIDIRDYYCYDYSYNQHGDYHGPKVRTKTFLLLKNGEHLGRVDLRTKTDGYHERAHREWFREFLKKFGKRLKLDDIFDRVLLFREYSRYQIPFQTLLAGCRNFKRNPEEFIQNVRKAEDEEEFLILTGLF